MGCFVMFDVVNYQRDDFLLTTDFNKLDLDAVCYLLSQSYWANSRGRDVTLRALENSLCFSLFYKDKQIGFMRLVTDYTTFAYLTDVIIDEFYRFEGLGSWCIECLLSHPELQTIRRWCLATSDAHDFYRKFGFNNLLYPEKFMELLNI